MNYLFGSKAESIDEHPMVVGGAPGSQTDDAILGAGGAPSGAAADGDDGHSINVSICWLPQAAPRTGCGPI